MTEVFWTPGRTKVLGRLLLVTLVIAGVLGVIGLLILAVNPQRYVVTLLVVAALFGASGGAALRALRARAESTRRLSIITGVLVIVGSLPLAPILVGMLTIILGVGILVVVFAPERDS